MPRDPAVGSPTLVKVQLPVNASFEMRAAIAMSDAVRYCAMGDSTWTGIIEVLVSDLGGVVSWEPDSVVLELADGPYQDRVADLDGLSLSLGRMGVPVKVDSSHVSVPDASLAEFMHELAKYGLTEDVASLAA